MAEGEEEDTIGQTISTDDMQQDIFRLDAEINAMTDKAVSATYRCQTCCKLATEHPDGNVKYCNRKKSSIQEYGASLLRQHESVKRALELLQRSRFMSKSILK